jgi:tetratricopeptide (TPR) repeat protein
MSGKILRRFPSQQLSIPTLRQTEHIYLICFAPPLKAIIAVTGQTLIAITEIIMVKDDRKNKLLANALANLKRDKLGMGIDLLDEILLIDPNSKVALLARGSVYLKMGNANNAKSDFSRILDIDANHPKAYHLRGLSRQIEGDIDGALNDFNRAIDIDPKYGAAYYSRSILLTKKGQDTKAAEDMKMVAQPTNVGIQNFANENNLWRSQQLRFENILEDELEN